VTVTFTAFETEKKFDVAPQGATDRGFRGLT
jgi:hypothetical protein